MFKKIKLLYPNSILDQVKPTDHYGRYHWFQCDDHEWIGIPKADISKEHLELLKILFDYHQTGLYSHPASESAIIWYQYLFEDGSFPTKKTEEPYRLIYFQWNHGTVPLLDFESALNAFFESNIIIVWESQTKGLIIESHGKQTLSENELLAMFETLKADFFIETYFYVGKFRTLSHTFKELYQMESELFQFCIRTFKQDKLFHFEKLVPYYLVSQLPEDLKQVIQHDIIPIFHEDAELFTTIKQFLQNNMNASITSKKLFVHRNTLQYRLDKFTEKAGIPLKDSYSAMTVYLACILFETEA